MPDLPTLHTSNEQKWFEMADIRKRRLDAAAWIPLRAAQKTATGTRGCSGYLEEFFGAASLAVPLRKRSVAADFGWRELNLTHDHCGSRYSGRYVPADEYDDRHLKGAIPLVLSQRGNSLEPRIWHVHPDLVIALRLKREGNVWVAMDEDYAEVIRLKADEDDRPTFLEIRAEHLKDYLRARRMALRVSWYREREAIVDEKPEFNWPELEGQYKDGERWEGRVTPIHEGGEPFGASIAVMRVRRTNLDFDEDVPQVGISDDSETTSFTRPLSQGRKLYRVTGELWRAEWVEPGRVSSRICGDEPEQAITFVADAAGKRKAAKSLVDSGTWLWFRPELIPALIERRGGALEWYTRETGGVRGSPDHNVPFGINSLGLVNAYAKDVALLPEWLQRVWAGLNVTPEGKVSPELFMAQGQGVPARSLAPEPFLPIGLELLNKAMKARFGKELFRPQANGEDSFKACHRFRALNESGLFRLAKDLSRVVFEHIDTTMLHRIVAPPPKEKWGSLKSMEKVLASVTGDAAAHTALGPFHGIYNLRLADAHVPSKNDLDAAYELARVDRTLPFVMQGRDLLIACVSSLHTIADLLQTAP
jgi:hypothetical protein